VLDLLSLVFGIVLGSIVDFVFTIYIEWRGLQWSKKEFKKLERKIDEIAKKLKV